MRRQKLTQPLIKSGKLAAEARRSSHGRVEVRDVESNLILRVTDKSARSFIVRPRLQGRPIRLKVGDAAHMSVADARSEARRIAELCAKGIDPRIAKRERERQAREAQSQTFDAVVDRFVELYAEKRQRTWRETKRILKVNCKNWLSRPITSITKSEAQHLVDGFVAAGNDAKARVTLSWLRKLWRWAWQRDLVDAPVMDAVTVEVDRKVRDRRYSDKEIKAIWRGADKMASLDGAFVKLCLLLAVRKSELAGMRRSEFDDLDNPMLWTIPFERTKSKKSTRPERQRVYVVPLPPQARRILKNLYRAHDDLVFPGRSGTKPMDPGTWLTKRVRKNSGVEDFYFHACRDTVATWLKDQGHSTYERALILNHAETGVTADYSHGHAADLKRELLERWAGHVEQLLRPKRVHQSGGKATVS